MKFQGYMEKEPVLRLMFFSASIFFILTLFPLYYDSFLKSTYNSYSVLVTQIDKIPTILSDAKIEVRIHNSSTILLTTSSTSTNITFIDKDANNATETKVGEPDIHNSSISTVKHVSTSNTSRQILVEEEKVSKNRRDGLTQGESSMNTQLRRLVRGQEGLAELESTGISCDSTDPRLDLCVINKSIVLEKHKNSLNIYATSSKNAPSKRVIRPYPKKEDTNTMSATFPVNILEGNIKPPLCEVMHNVPALVFSFGGFTDNNFHKFSEVLIPLFATSRHFGSRVQFVVTDNKLGETWKFSKVLKSLSPYEVIDANVEDDHFFFGQNVEDDHNKVHCFPSAVIGLRYFDNLEINNTDTPGGYTMSDFKAFLRESYNLKVPKILKPTRPKVLLISRKKSRSLLNEDIIARQMKKMGFRVHKVKPDQMSNLEKLSKIVNSCDLMVGVHGAGLTNAVFLPDGAVVVQIVPLGLEWASEHYFGIPTQNMGLKYLEYKIGPIESSLYNTYGPNDPIVSDPASVWTRGFGVVKDLYIDRQQVRVDLKRFRSTLLEALELLGIIARLN